MHRIFHNEDSPSTIITSSRLWQYPRFSLCCTPSAVVVYCGAGQSRSNT